MNEVTAIDTPALLDDARRALATSNGRIAEFSHAGALCIAKAPGTVRGRAQSLLLKAFCRIALGSSVPLEALRLASGEERLAREAARLRALAAAGEAVPQVLALAPDCLVLEHVGDTLEQSLFPLNRAEIFSRLIAATDDLARFHEAGHWHGGSQVKNMTLRNGRLFRIDFEEDLGKHLPLPVTQAYDVVLLVNSSTLLCDLDEQASTALATDMFKRYLAARPDPALRATLARALPALGFACKLFSPLRNRRGRSLKRIFILRDALGTALAA